MHFVPVVIVGGGPVGMALAMNLSVFEIPTMIINIEPSSRWHPKGSTHNARTMEHYRRFGISSEIRALGMPGDHPTDVGYFTTLNGWELARIRMPSEREKLAHVAAAKTTDQVPEPLFRCNQMYVEARLFEKINTISTIEPRYGWRAISISEQKERVCITIEEVETGTQKEVECSYLAGCDGGRSMVRDYLGFGYTGEKPKEQAYGSGATVSTHLRAPNLRQIVREPCWQHWTVSPKVRSNLVTLDGEGEFLFNTKIPNPDDKPDEAFIAKMFHLSVGETISTQFLGHWVWTAGQALVAERFGRRRILLAGDAVHLFTPTGGFGMNTGVDDAANLGWKIAAMVNGWGGPNLLTSYEVERRPIAIRNTGMAKEFSRSVGKVQVTDKLLDASPSGDAARAALGEHLQTFGEEFASIGVQLGARYDGSPIVVIDGSSPPTDDPLIYQPSACPGGRAPHLFLPDGSSLFDHFGIGFTLMRLAGHDDARGIAKAAELRGIPFKILQININEGRDLYDCDFALIRPDQHVAWRSNTLPDDCDALLAHVTGW